MNCLHEVDISCPYCGEVIGILVDGSIEEQHYIEDCQVCCQPIVIALSISSNDEFHVEARHENDA